MRLTLLLLILFVIATAIITAAGRVNFGLSQALSGRYRTPALMVWFSMFLIWFEHASFLENERFQDWKKLFLTGALLTLILLFPYQVRGLLLDTGQLHFSREVGMLAIAMELPDDRFVHILYPSTEAVLATARRAKENSIGIFAQDWYKKVQQTGYYIEFDLPHQANIKGNCEAIEHIGYMEGSKTNVYRVEGWLASDKNRIFLDDSTQLVLTDAEGKVIGYGVSGNERRVDCNSDLVKHQYKAEWVAYIIGDDWERAYIFSYTDNGLHRLLSEIEVSACLNDQNEN
jgi:hypothetical protein